MIVLQFSLGSLRSSGVAAFGADIFRGESGAFEDFAGVWSGHGIFETISGSCGTEAPFFIEGNEVDVKVFGGFWVDGGDAGDCF